MDINVLRTNLENSQRNYELLVTKSASADLRPHFIDILLLIELDMAVYAMVLDQDFTKARNFFSNAAIDLEYKHVKYGADVFYSTRNLCFAILSDHDKAIGRCLDMHTSAKGLGPAFGKALQAVLKQENTQLEQEIREIEEFVEKKTWEKHFAGAVNAFTGLLKRDAALLERGVRDLLAAHKRQDQPSEYFNIEAATVMKLAGKMGMATNVDSPLIPKDILPVEEGLAFTGHEFFKELGY